MIQIYDFEQYNPPVLTEHMLYMELERRRLKTQTAVLALSGIILQFAVLFFGICMAEMYPLISITCFVYVFITFMGSGIIAFIYSKKGGFIL